MARAEKTDLEVKIESLEAKVQELTQKIDVLTDWVKRGIRQRRQNYAAV